MEKIVENVINSLTKQREKLVEEVNLLDHNNLNYAQKMPELTAQITMIDARVDILLDKLTK